MYIYMCVCVCEQLPGANSSPIVTKLRHLYTWPQRTRWLNFGRSKVKVSGGGMHSTKRPSSFSWIGVAPFLREGMWHTWIFCAVSLMSGKRPRLSVWLAESIASSSSTAVHALQCHRVCDNSILYWTFSRVLSEWKKSLMLMNHCTLSWSCEFVFYRIFTLWHYASTVHFGIVCLSVCPSQAGTVPKWLNAGSRIQRYMIAQGL